MLWCLGFRVLGSAQYVTNDEQFIVQHDEYFPTGELWRDETDSRYSLARRYLFAGGEVDLGTGLHHFGARYYDSRQGQWISPDPILGSYMGGAPNGGVYFPANLSLYAYSANNPVVLRDEGGEFWHIVGGAAIGAILGGGVELGRQLYNGDGVNWSRVGSSATGGAVAGGLAAASGGTSLATTLAVGGGSSIAGGATTRALNGESTSVGDVVVDGTIGVATAGLVRGGQGLLRNSANSADDAARAGNAGSGSGATPSAGHARTASGPAEQAAHRARTTNPVPSTIDPNRINHIFGQARHNLDPVVERFGTQHGAYEAIDNATQAAVRQGRISGTFETVVNVGGFGVTVRGRVVEGTARIGTAFIPPP